jgi:hypothetical protein
MMPSGLREWPRCVASIDDSCDGGRRRRRKVAAAMQGALPSPLVNEAAIC